MRPELLGAGVGLPGTQPVDAGPPGADGPARIQVAVVAPAVERRSHPRAGRATVALRGPATISISHGSTFLVASSDASVEGAHAHGDALGLFSDDTRFVSAHRLRLNGRPLRCIAATRLTYRHARWTLVATDVAGVRGNLEGTHVVVTLDRTIGDRRFHEDLCVRYFGTERVALLLDVEVESDFADLFEVRTERWQRREGIETLWTPPGRLETRYLREDFVRRCVVRSGTAATYANGALHFAIDLTQGEEWSTCLQYDLLRALRARPSTAPPCPLRSGADRGEQLRRRWHRTVARARPSDLRLLTAFEQAVDDFAALRLYDHDYSPEVWLPAAGIPWFVAVFGRDSLLASYQALTVHPLFAAGTLQTLARWQSTMDDPVRDAEPGKICHEMRVGEWARFAVVPHSPYYGTADATPLYLLLLAYTYRWLGDSELLRAFRGTAERCLEWMDRHGDRDGDGFQEYAPRAPGGYRNQCWRDAEDGVLDEEGRNLKHPIATCEMQAYAWAAKREVAGLFEAWGDAVTAARLRDEAALLRRRFLDAFWLDDEGTVAFALDGDKRPVRTATSNPGHVLWLGMLDDARAQRVADRLMRPDLFCGWGLRTLSSDHPAFDPHSYQRGSVWPHDTMLAAAGLRRHGRIEDAWRLIDGLLTAVMSFERTQMPELFAGLQRGRQDAPVPYERANVPQAWAAGAVFHAVRILLGLEPDVPAGRIHVDPALPPWCPELHLDNLRVGSQRITVKAWRNPDGSCDAAVESDRGGLEVVRGRPGWTSSS